MGSVGACGDNAATESFFALLQKDVLDKKRGETLEELRLAIVNWIEKTYYCRRRQAAVGTVTPIEFETINSAALAAGEPRTQSVNQNLAVPFARLDYR